LIAEKVGDDTTFAKIIELVEEAQDAKSKTERFLDRFANYYTPGIVLLAALVFIITRDLHLAITFLVIACPGALVIGAPVSNVAGIGNGAKHGVLIKGGEIMERLAKVDTLVFDKTGTLTKGKPEVTDIHLLGNMAAEQILALVAKAETVSEHPLGQTIVKEAESKGMDLNNYHLSAGEAIKGHGITATVDGHTIAAGNRKLMKREGIAIDKKPRLCGRAGKTGQYRRFCGCRRNTFRHHFHCRPNPRRCESGPGRYEGQWRKKNCHVNGRQPPHGRSRCPAARHRRIPCRTPAQ